MDLQINMHLQQPASLSFFDQWTGTTGLALASPWTSEEVVMDCCNNMVRGGSHLSKSLRTIVRLYAGSNSLGGYAETLPAKISKNKKVLRLQGNHDAWPEGG